MPQKTRNESEKRRSKEQSCQYEVVEFPVRRIRSIDCEKKCKASHFGDFSVGSDINFCQCTRSRLNESII